MTVTVEAGDQQVQLVVPERLGITTDDPAVTFVSAGRGHRPCNLGQDAPSSRQVRGPCLALWQIEGPGTFRLILEPTPPPSDDVDDAGLAGEVTPAPTDAGEDPADTAPAAAPPPLPVTGAGSSMVVAALALAAAWALRSRAVGIRD
jgi:hypothetical protein